MQKSQFPPLLRRMYMNKMGFLSISLEKTNKNQDPGRKQHICNGCNSPSVSCVCPAHSSPCFVLNSKKRLYNHCDITGTKTKPQRRGSQRWVRGRGRGGRGPGRQPAGGTRVLGRPHAGCQVPRWPLARRHTRRGPFLSLQRYTQAYLGLSKNKCFQCLCTYTHGYVSNVFIYF